MHSFLLSSSFVIGVVSAGYALVPSSSYVDVTSVAGTIESDRVSALFSIPFEDESETLDIVLDIGSTDRECLDSNLYLNGESLVLAAPGAERFQFSVPHYTGDNPPVFEAVGSLTCLRGEASLVDLRIYSSEQPDTAIAAVVFSYKQAGQPALNRLLYGSPEALALHLTTLSTDLPAWTHPADDVKVAITPFNGHTSSESNMPEGLEAQLLRLDLLKHHAADIQKEIKATEAKIMSLWKSEFSKCNSIGCYLKTAVAKAPTLAHLVASHLSHHTHIDADFFRNSTHMNCTMEVEKVVEQHEKQMVLVNLAGETESEEEVGLTPADDKSLEVADDSLDDSSSADTPHENESDDEGADDTPPSSGRRPPWRHGPGRGGRPPWAKPGSRPPWAQGGKPPFGRPPWAKPGGYRPWATEENNTPAASGPSNSEESGNKGDTTYRVWPFSITPQDRFKIAAFFIAALVVGATILVLACAVCIRRKCMFLRDPRRKADCAARREERRTRALYRKAACKHRMRTFFQRFRLPRPFSSSDYEEKRVFLTTDQDESSSSGGIIGPQIDRLRTFHEFLFREVTRRAERSATPAPSRQQQGEQTPAELDAADRSSVRSETLPAYSLPPPSYRNGMGSDFSVVTGFTGYTPSGSGDTADADPDVDDLTESSIVDCSPRLSFESQRTGGTRGRE